MGVRELWDKTLVAIGFGEEEYDSEEMEDDDDNHFVSPSYDDASDNPPHLSAIPLIKTHVHIIEPRSFGEAQKIGDKFKISIPVIMNLSGTGPELAKRLLDFASGMTYVMGGSIQKVGDRIFLLTPRNVTVSAEEKKRWQDKGFKR